MRLFVSVGTWLLRLKYELVQIELVKLDYASPLRTELKRKILLSLLEKERKIADFRSIVVARETSILHVLEEFQRLNLLTKTEGTYKLSSLGLIIALTCKEHFSNIEVIEKFKDFWLLHDLRGIPRNLLLAVNALEDSMLIRSEPSELNIVHETFIEIAKASKRMKGISPIFHSDFTPLFGQLLEKGNTIELIVSSDVLKKITGSADLSLLGKYLGENKLKVFLKNDLKVALLLTENVFSLGLFASSGEYDDKMDLVSRDKRAIEWGERLFEETLEGSRKLELDMLT
jgi:predicted transcriptional regulator